MNSELLYDKVVKDDIDDEVKDEILKILGKLNKVREAKLLTNKRYLEKIKNDDEKMNRIREQKNDYYKNNKELVNVRLREKYKNNVEYQEQKKKTTLELYHTKNDNTPKMKRGRKPIPEEDKKVKIVVPSGRPVGRPKKILVQ
jgi:uncharacterized coiled-coil DUF342 family protein